MGARPLSDARKTVTCRFSFLFPTRPADGMAGLQEPHRPKPNFSRFGNKFVILQLFCGQIPDFFGNGGKMEAGICRFTHNMLAVFALRA